MKPEQIQQRKFFTLNEWLTKPEFKELPENQYSALQVEIFSKFVETFFSKTNIYDNSEPTNFAKKTLMNPAFIQNNLVKAVYLLTKNITPEQQKSKEN